MKVPELSSTSARMLVIGAGNMGKLVIKHLVAKGCTKMVVVNRPEETVAAIREEMKDVDIIYKPLTEILTCAAEADVVFASTGSESLLFFKENIETLPSVGPEVGGFRLFIDISVPRNVGSCISELESARVYNVDDLKEVVEANKEDRLRKAMQAQAIIGAEAKEFEAWRDSLGTVPTLKKLRAFVDGIRVAELKILDGPMPHLRCDGSDGRTLSETLENMHALNRMFGLETDMSVLEQSIRAKLTQK